MNRSTDRLIDSSGLARMGNRAGPVMARLLPCTTLSVLPHPIRLRNNFKCGCAKHKDSFAQRFRPRSRAGGIAHLAEWCIAVDTPAIHHGSAAIGMNKSNTTVIHDERQHGAFGAFNNAIGVFRVGEKLSTAIEGEDVSFHNILKAIRCRMYRRE